jgi:hypothetical protein
MSASFKLLCVDNHSKDLLTEVKFLVWRPYLGGGEGAVYIQARLTVL